MGRYFGTDGIRGIAGEDLTPELAMAASAAAVKVLSAGGREVIVGEDTRGSSRMLSSAIAAGLTAQGADALMAGVVPTPAVAALISSRRAAAGIVVSASHNPYEYNGIKVFGPDGFKLPDETEDRIEAELEAMLHRAMPVCAGKESIGRVADYSEAQAVYEDFLAGSCGGRLDGLKVVLDCANGAAFQVAPEAFRRLGAAVVAINDRPDGSNINVDCGATAPCRMAELTARLGFDLGFSFDGDADRSIMSDETGRVLDGDFEMAILAGAMKSEGSLGGDAVVATAYSNMGLEEALGSIGLAQLTAANGDRYVLEIMRANGLNLGGEQSGHIVMLDKTTTGDGPLTAIRLAMTVLSSGRKASELASVMRKYPQGQKAVRVARKQDLAEAARVWETVRRAEEELSGRGRILVRASGTEPVVRVMVEAADDKAVAGWLDLISRAVEECLS